MRILITGGTGLIGQELVSNLASSGHAVTVLSRFPQRAPTLPTTVQLEHWDGRTPDGWGHLMDGTEAVINLAGENLASGHWTMGRKHAILESRVNAGQAIVAAVRAAAQKPAILIQASAVGYYGRRGKEEITETSPAGNDFLAQICKEWEASTAPVEQLGVKRAVVRLGVVLSSFGGALPRLVAPFRFFVGGPLGNGQQWMPWIHIEDAVRALKYFAENQTSGVYNLCSPTPATNLELSRAIGRRLRRPCWLPVPAFLLRLWLGEMANVLLVSQRLAPKNLQRTAFRFNFPTVDAAVRDLVF